MSHNEPRQGGCGSRSEPRHSTLGLRGASRLEFLDRLDVEAGDRFFKRADFSRLPLMIDPPAHSPLLALTLQGNDNWRA